MHVSFPSPSKQFLPVVRTFLHLFKGRAASCPERFCFWKIPEFYVRRGSGSAPLPSPSLPPPFFWSCPVLSSDGSLLTATGAKNATTCILPGALLFSFLALSYVYVRIEIALFLCFWYFYVPGIVFLLVSNYDFCFMLVVAGVAAATAAVAMAIIPVRVDIHT
ncbi:unnamed protein product [Laminaria digitata]